MKKPFLLTLIVLSLFLAVPGMTAATDEADIEKYQQAIRENPNDAEAHLKLGVAYAGLGRLQEAIAEFKLAAEQGHGLDAIHSRRDV